ncbi:hypothetical protein GW658_21455 [Escherichia coli]|uniref:hypothetical protein n=1 Tax=Escherichia coli TaxID=562 RepID=UPI00164FF781|nr:hypothetical protein [Escherichia coli]MBC6577756.1 hypothetical protein [Escherichia coli]
MFILRNKRKESGLSLIETSLVIILSGLVIVLIQSAISKVIKHAVHENALHDISYVMSYIQNTLQTSCYEKNATVCDEKITSVKSSLNTGNKIKVDIKRNEKYVSVYVLYILSDNEDFGRDGDFGSMLFTHASAYYGRIDGKGVVSSVLGWWQVNSDSTIFSGGDDNKNLFFYNNFRVDVL